MTLELIITDTKYIVNYYNLNKIRSRILIYSLSSEAYFGTRLFNTSKEKDLSSHYCSLIKHIAPFSKI